MPQTPTFLLPYPAPGSAADVPYDMQQLAEAVEARLQGLKRAAGGRVTLTPSGGAAPYSASVTVTFPAGRFTAAPAVTATPESIASTNMRASASSVTTTGFTLTFFRDNTTATPVSWTAVEI